MRFGSLFLAAMAVCLVAGCSTTHPQIEGSYSVQALYALDGKPVTLTDPTVPPVDCPAGGPADTCSIKVSVTDPSCNDANIVLPEYVKLPPIGSKDKIVWTLPFGYFFCQRAGDGVFLNDPSVPDDLFDPKHNSKCSDTLEWKRKKTDGKNRRYYLRFRSASAICQKDPWMLN